MRSSRGGFQAARLLTVAALVLAVIAVGWLMFGSGDGYRVSMTLDNAGQLVAGNQVKIGGYPVGEIKEIELQDDSRARIELEIEDDEIAPLHEGTVATLRATSLSGIANRYIALAPGPNDRPEIPDGGEIRAEDGRAAVDLDQVLNTLDPQTQRELQTFISNVADVFSDGEERTEEVDMLSETEEGAPRDSATKDQKLLKAAREANAGLRALNPALSQSARTARELTRDQRAFERFIVDSAEVVGDVASRPDDLEQLVGNALSATSAVAGQSQALDSSLAQLPPVLRQANTTLVNLRATVKDLRPAVREARPGAPLLSDFLEKLGPVSREGLPAVRRLRRTINRDGSRNDLTDTLRGLVDLEKEAVPAFESTVKTVQDALPVVYDARPYTPDLIAGLFNGFGGTTGGYYDANGHYARISFQGSVFSTTGAGSLLPLPPSQQGLTGYEKNVTRRCPGAGTQPAEDRSNPYIERDDFPCDREATP